MKNGNDKSFFLFPPLILNLILKAFGFCCHEECTVSSAAFESAIYVIKSESLHVRGKPLLGIVFPGEGVGGAAGGLGRDKLAGKKR